MNQISAYAKSILKIWIGLVLINIFIISGILSLAGLHFGFYLAFYLIMILIVLEVVGFIIFKKAVSNPRVKHPMGFRLDEVGNGGEKLNHLIQLLYEVTNQMKIDPPFEILITHEMNAKIILNNPYGRKWDASYRLYIGMPMFLALTKDEFKSVIAHELAHGQKKQVGPKLKWLKSRHQWLNLKRLLISMPWHVNHAIKIVDDLLIEIDLKIFKMNYENEFLADRNAVNLTSPGVFGSALLKVNYYTDQINKYFWPDFYQVHKADASPPDDVYGAMQDYLTHLSMKEYDNYLELLQEEINFPNDEHPTIMKRLNQMGVDVHKLKSPKHIDSMIALEASSQDVFKKALSDHWKKAILKSWNERFEVYHDLTLQFRKTLMLLEEDPENSGHYIEISKYYEYTFEIQKAFNAIEKALILSPDSYVCQFHWARFVLNMDVESDTEVQVNGLVTMETLMEISSSWAYASAFQLFTYYANDKQYEEALKYLRIAQCLVYQNLALEVLSLSEDLKFEPLQYPKGFKAFMHHKLMGFKPQIEKLYVVSTVVNKEGIDHKSDVYFIKWHRNDVSDASLLALKKIIGCPILGLNSQMELKLLGVQGSRWL